MSTHRGNRRRIATKSERDKHTAVVPVSRIVPAEVRQHPNDAPAEDSDRRVEELDAAARPSAGTTGREIAIAVDQAAGLWSELQGSSDDTVLVPADVAEAKATHHPEASQLISVEAVIESLQSENSSLTASLSERFSEIAKLTTMYIAAKNHSERAEARAEQFRIAAGSAESASKQVEQLGAQLRAKVEENRKLLAECTRLESACKALEAQKHLAQKNAEGWAASIAESERVIEALRVALQSAKRNRSEALAAVPAQKTLTRKLTRIFGNPQSGRADAVLSAKIRLIENSGLFDAAWYAEKYPDVKAANVDPAEHFIRWGGAEGRDPGPLFSSSQYTMANPDVAEQCLNPLIHYINHGMEEGRLITDKIGSSTHE